MNVALCPRLSAPSNGKVQVEGVKAGSSARYTCNDGYKLRGDTTRICQEGGQWSGQEPICQGKGVKKHSNSMIMILAYVI